MLFSEAYYDIDNVAPGLILGLRPANERRRYKVTPSLIGWSYKLRISPEHSRLFIN